MKDQVGKIITEIMLSINRFLNVNFLSVLDPDLDLDLDLLFPIFFFKII